MTYREEERKKAIDLRNEIFNDPGNGIYKGVSRDFVLSKPALNLWCGIREDALDYFSRNDIAWWAGAEMEPTGHLLSSQIACVNHLYFLRQRKDLASAILMNIDSDFVEACIVDDGYVEFEFIGERPYLKEKSFTRGANCTSVDAVMMGLLKDGTKRFVFIEWKYTESYPCEDKYIPERACVYDGFITAPDSPFIAGLDPRALYYEPFYQLMRQTLLADLCVKHKDHGASSYIHVDVVPTQNKALLDQITSPYLKGATVAEAWKGVLKSPQKFLDLTPESLLNPVSRIPDSKSALVYLQKRYWM